MARLVCLAKLSVVANSRLVVDVMLVYFESDTDRDMQYATYLTKLWQEFADHVSERNLFIGELEVLSGQFMASNSVEFLKKLERCDELKMMGLVKLIASMHIQLKNAGNGFKDLTGLLSNYGVLGEDWQKGRYGVSVPALHKRPRRNKDQYDVSRRSLYAVFNLKKLFKTLSLDESISLEYNLFSDLEENSKEEVAKTMAETMEQYMSKTRADYGLGIARPKIDDKDYFELKGQFIKELRDNTFNGSDHEDANEHIEKVLEIDKNTKTSDGLAAIQVQLNNLGREIKKVNEKVYDSQFGAPFQQGGQYRAAALGFYERNNANPSYQERRQSMEESLSKFMSESAKRHEENSNLIKEIRASTDTERGFGSLPSSTETNPRDHVISISTTVEADMTPIRHIRSSQYAVSAQQNNFIILDMPEDVKVPLILGRPFLSTTHAKIDVFKRKITLRVGDEKIIFKSMKHASSLIKSVYMLGLREQLRRDHVDDFIPTIEEGECFIIAALELSKGTNPLQAKEQDIPPPTITAMKIPIIRKGEYDIWSMRMRQYICHTDHNLWDVIVNGDLEEEPAPTRRRLIWSFCSSCS
ncbi:putative reverse transcriptase domain-containing protein [Tanacetum coccineum]